MDQIETLKSGDAALLGRFFAKHDLEAVDREGHTPLMLALQSKDIPVATVKWLIERGANVGVVEAPPALDFDDETLAILKDEGFEMPAEMAVPRRLFPLLLAAKHATREKLELLLEHGVDVNFADESGYTALLHACYGVFERTDEESEQIFRLLLSAGAKFPVPTTYGETVPTVLSIHGHFKMLRCVLDLGANADYLDWTPLCHAIVFGDLPEVEGLLQAEVDLEHQDYFDRTPLLLAVSVDKLDIAKRLVAAGAKANAESRGGQGAVQLAIERDHVEILKWLVEIGADVASLNEFGNRPLQEAVEHEAFDCVRYLLESGADPFAVSEYEFGLMHDVQSVEMFRVLADYGLGGSEVSGSLRKELCGHSDIEWSVAKSDFEQQRARRFGKSNPELMNCAFWDAMLQSRATAYQANEKFGVCGIDLDEPTWCFDRFGMSLTLLPDGRIVEIGGEHEDSYDPDFCIYNEVVVHDGSGGFEIYGYPASVFPPTDFHSATLLAEQILIIGSLGYPEERQYGTTPVYKLNIRDWSIQAVATTGDEPSWIHRHTADLVDDKTVRVRFGKIGTQEKQEDNQHQWTLNLQTNVWTRLPG